MKTEMSISLDKLHTVLGWPKSADVTHPAGAGAAVFAALARKKIGRSLAGFADGQQAIVGVLLADSEAVATEPPLALVVDFQQDATEETLRELHRMSWNFSHSPTLITIEPGLVRAWTCCEAPDPHRRFDDFLVHKINLSDLNEVRVEKIENRAVRALHWINLVSGEFFSQHAARFDRDGRADQMLLGNLRDIRAKLWEAGLQDDDVCHDLLARIIFVQFLFDRKDSEGAAALTRTKLTRLYTEGILGQAHDDFASILANYSDTYRLFEWLNTRFNGDLFPGKGDTPNSRSLGWAKEKDVVKTAHLAMLGDFIRGDLDMSSGQTCLWPQYSFDVIPLEFISSIYETFVTERAAQDGIFYTPPHLVDFVLDRVLPWDGLEWDLKVLDPACGSGIFLVKAFQRLVHRWKQANPDKTIRAEILRNLLERNIFGVDKDPHAVRVACFSLYLAMCDEIEPRHYWTQIVFPNMRERRLICSDFFMEGRTGFDTRQNAGTYDLVVGNAPWGDGLVTESAIDWAKADGRKWTVANKDIGGLFLAKAAHLVAQAGRIAMIQSANSLLFNGSTKAIAFRKEIFAAHRIEEIYNLSALRFKVFKRKSHTTKTSTSPACVMVMRSEKPALDDRITYISPKHLKPLVDEFTIIIEPQDRRRLTVREAVSDNLIWITLMWGSSRDRTLLEKLKRYPSLSATSDQPVQRREGIIFGDRSKPAPQLAERKLFNRNTFPDGSMLYMDADALPLAGEIKTHSRDSTDFSAFTWPQLIIKQSWQKSTGRFQARLTRSTKEEGVICNQSYVTIHGSKTLLEAACLSFNSLVAVYFLQLTSGRIAAYRPEAQVRDLLNLPLPTPQPDLLKSVEAYVDLDTRAFDAFGLKDAERILIEDMVQYTIEDFRGDENSRGRRSTTAADADANESHLRAYCEYFTRVLKAGFGRDKAITTTIFQGERDDPLPYRLVAFQLGGVVDSTVNIARIKTVALIHELERLDSSMRQSGAGRRGIYNERVARIYDSSSGTPTIFIVKPDMARYWTRSVGLYDGDEVALDLFRWQQAAQKNPVLQ